MVQLALENQVPGFDIPKLNDWDAWVTWPLRGLRTFAVGSQSWTRTLRDIAMNTYKRLNTARAE